MRSSSSIGRSPHDLKLVQFCNPGSKIWGPKTCKIWCVFGQLQTLIANISGTDRDIQNRTNVLTAITPGFSEKKSDELWSTNNKVLHVNCDPPKSTYSVYHISASG